MDAVEPAGRDETVENAEALGADLGPTKHQSVGSRGLTKAYSSRVRVAVAGLEVLLHEPLPARGHVETAISDRVVTPALPNADKPSPTIL